jgi:hypothetical protein
VTIGEGGFAKNFFTVTKNFLVLAATHHHHTTTTQPRRGRNSMETKTVTVAAAAETRASPKLAVLSGDPQLASCSETLLATHNRRRLRFFF